MTKLSIVVFTIVLSCAVGAGADKKQEKSAASQPSSAKQEASPQAAKPAEKKADDCGCEAKTPPDNIVAVVNGVKLTLADIDEPLKDKIRELQNQVIEARKRELDLQINSKLLDAEAKKRGLTTTKLLDQEVVSKVKTPTEAEAQAFYEQNKARIEGEFKDLKGEIINYLLNQRQGEEAKKLADRLRAAAQVKVLIETVTPPATAADRARVIATVNGERITSGDIEDSLRPIIFNVQEEIHSLRKRQLDMKINDMLLEQEAQKRKVTTGALLEAEIAPKVKPVTEQDAQKFYDQNKDRIEGDFAQLKPQIIEYLKRVEQRNAEGAFAGQLRSAASIQEYLTEPDPPVYNIATDDQPFKGGANAAVVIVEFTDFECPSCARSQPVLEEVVKEYGDKVKLVARDFPLSQHVNAFKAAEAAEAAREQGKYWEYTALLFQNQSALGVDKLKEYAGQLGLDRKKFDEALDSGRFSDKVQRDQQDGFRIGVNATPTVFINGQRLRDRSRESLKAAIEAALKNVAKK